MAILAGKKVKTKKGYKTKKILKCEEQDEEGDSGIYCRKKCSSLKNFMQTI